MPKIVVWAVAVGLVLTGLVVGSYDATSSGQQGYEGQPGNQGNGQQGYEGQPGNQGGGTNNNNNAPGLLGYEGHPGNQGG